MVANPIRLFHEARLRRWPITGAQVDTCSWVEATDNLGSKTGHYDVTFRYEAQDGQHRGRFSCSGSPQVAPYQSGEKIPIQYNPKRPSSNIYSGADTGYEKIEAILVMTLFALIAGYVLYSF